MAIKTDAMIAHNGADGYTLHVEYDPATEDFAATAVFNDGTEKDLSGGGGAELNALIDRSNAPWGATHATINYGVEEPNPPVGLSITPNPGLIQNIDLEPVEDIQPVVEVKKTRKAAK